jgi:hypothetical protein
MKPDMPKAKPTAKAGRTKQTAFRFTAEEIATIDAIAREIAGKTPITISRTDVIRVGIALAKAKYLKGNPS